MPTLSEAYAEIELAGWRSMREVLENTPPEWVVLYDQFGREIPVRRTKIGSTIIVKRPARFMENKRCPSV